jgi:NlpC/P60 family putative phage cell wall peptidase
MTPEAMQEALISEARRWVGTPYKHRGRHLHQAVDCLGLIFGIMQAVGLGSDKFWTARNQEYATYRRVPDGRTLYQGFTRWVPEYPRTKAQPGDMLLIAFAGAPRHTALLTNDNTIIHAHSEAKGCVENDWCGSWWQDTTTAFRLIEFSEEGRSWQR